MQSLLSGRSELAEDRLAVTATQIVERLRIRASHLEQLMEEELKVGSEMLQLDGNSSGIHNSDMMGLESLLAQKKAEIQAERRREDTECWRDLTNVMRDFLNAWEGFSRNEAKNRFLALLPKANLTPVAAGQEPNPPFTYHNDNRNPYFQPYDR
ncbi:hypothetical protein P4E94_18610 [Pontiellaceae bacterium B12219]|nr:hypothetical protein [Pontiellaceae bacterium B12219]